MSASLSNSPEATPAMSARPWTSLVLIAAAIALAYSNSLHGPFVLDDLGSIPENPSIRRLWPPAEVLTGATFATVVGRPLLNVSLAVNYALHKLSLPGYHLFNIIAHILTAWSLFGVVHRTLRLPRFAKRFPPTTARGLATAVAMLWGVHPLTTSAVTYTVQRGEVMAAGWYLATLYCVIRGFDANRPDRWSVLAVMCCLLGIGTKETLVTAPVVVLFYDAVFLSGSLRTAVRRRPGLYVGLFATWLPLVALMRSSGGRSETAGIGYGMGVLDYASSQFGYVLNYLKLSIWPRPLVFDYGDQLARSWTEIVIPASVLLVLFVVLFFIGLRKPAIAFLGFSPFLILAPTSTVVPLVTQTAAEHRMYLPLAFVVTLLVMTGWSFWFERSMVRQPRRLSVIVVGIFVVLLGGLTWARNRDYRSEQELWLDTVAKLPDSARARNNLGRVYLEQGEGAKARRELEVSVTLKPENPVAWFNLGLACEQSRDYAAALKNLDEAIRLRPQHAASHLHRGIVHRHLDQRDAELTDLNLAIELDAGLAEAYVERAFAHAERGDLQSALRDATTAQRLGGKIPQGFLEKLAEPSNKSF